VPRWLIGEFAIESRPLNANIVRQWCSRRKNKNPPLVIPKPVFIASESAAAGGEAADSSRDEAALCGNDNL